MNRTRGNTLPALILLLALALVPFAPAHAGAPLPTPCSDGSCVPGGGKAATDCFAEFEGVYLNAPFSSPTKPKPKKEVRCFDGDAGCDLDGEVNGTCRFPANVCLFNADPNLAECTASPVSAITVKAKGAADEGAALQTAASALVPAPASVCTEGAFVDAVLPVTAKGVQKQRKVTVSVSATAAAGKDGDKLRLTCLPREWPAHGYDSYNRRATERTAITGANVATLVEKWTFETEGNVTSTPTVGGKLVYVTSWDGKIYAVDRKKGTEKWSFDTGTGAQGGIKSSATLTPDGRVVFGDSQANVYALDAKKGTLLWERNVEILPQDHIWGTPTVVNNRVFVPVASDGDNPCTKGRVEALDLDTGEPLWQARTTPDRVCEDDTNQGCTEAGDCTTGRCVGMCAGDRAIACVDDLECAGDAPCEDAIGGGITAAPATDPSGEIVFAASVGCYTGPRIGNADRIFRIEAATGEIIWALPDFPGEEFGLDGSYNDYGFLNGPIVVTDTPTPLVVAASKDGKIYARDAVTGAEAWTETVGDVTLTPDGFASFGLFNGPAAYADGRIFTSLNAFGDGSPVGIVHSQAFSIVDGDNEWVASQDIGATWGAVSTAGGVVYMGAGNLGGSNNFYAFDATNGQLLHTFVMPHKTTSGPSIVDSELFVGFGLRLGPAVQPTGVRAYELP
jgi:outer membrane protein assembly factor BamB